MDGDPAARNVAIRDVAAAKRSGRSPNERRTGMKKLRMEVESLHVESFPVAPELPAFRGTVHAEEAFATQALGCTHGATCRTSCGVVGNCTCPPPA